MTTSLDPNGANFLASLARITAEQSRAQQQLSSGYKVQYASDAPDQISELLQLESDLAQNTQVGKNLTLLQADANTGESGLQNAAKLLDNAVSLGTEGGNSTQTAAARQQLADQIQGIQEQLVGIANTQVAGRYIFSGDSDTQQPYQIDLTAANGVDRLVTAPATQQIQDAQGSSFSVAETAQTIFDHRNPDDTFASDNVFAALNSLRVALINNDTPGISTAIDSLNTASSYFNTQLAFYGSVQTRLDSAVNDVQTRDTSLRTQISSIRDADIAAATLDLTSANTAEQAALASEAKLPHTSLFNYLG